MTCQTIGSIRKTVFYDMLNPFTLQLTATGIDGQCDAVDLSVVDIVELTLPGYATLTVVRDDATPPIDWWSDDMLLGNMRFSLGEWAADNSVIGGKYYATLVTREEVGRPGMIWASESGRELILTVVED